MVRSIFCLWIAALMMAPPATAQDIVSHPDELTYPELHFDPPPPGDFRTELSNGAVAYITEDRELPLISVSLLIRGGSAWEPGEKTGLARLTGTMLREGGTESRPPDELDEEIDFLAANLSTSFGGTNGSATLNILSKDIEEGLDILMDVLRNPRFDQERFRIQRDQIRQNLARRNDQTSHIESREWSNLMYGEDHFAARDVTLESLNSITIDDMRDFHQKFVHPGNVMVVAAGDFEQHEMIAWLENAFAGWTPREPWTEDVPVPDHEPEAGVYMFNKDGVNQGRVSIGHRSITFDHPDRIPLQVMNGILGGSGFTSRIMSRVRSDEGLAYSAGSSFGVGTNYPAAFRAFFQSRSETAAYAARLVIDEIDRIRQQPVSQQEINTQINSMLERFPRSFASAYQMVLLYAQDEFEGRDPERWLTYRDEVRAVTIDDVQRAAAEHLHPENLVIVVVGDLDDIMRGDPRYEISFETLGPYPVHRFPLRDPLTMEFPPQ